MKKHAIQATMGAQNTAGPAPANNGVTKVAVDEVSRATYHESFKANLRSQPKAQVESEAGLTRMDVSVLTHVFEIWNEKAMVWKAVNWRGSSPTWPFALN